MKSFLIITLIFLSFSGNADDWIPDGMLVDNSGNVTHTVPLPDDFTGPKSTLTTLAYIAEIEKGQTIINLSKDSAFKVDAKYEENAPPPNDGSGFLVTKYFKVRDITLPVDALGGLGGITVGTDLLPVSAGPQVGVFAEIGAGMVGEIFVKKYKDIKKLPPFLKIPYNLELLKKYEIGDSFNYSVKGGLGLMIGAGVSAKIWKVGAGASVNVGFVGEGTWICHVKKTGPSTVQARYVKQKLFKLIAYAGAKAIVIKLRGEINKFDGVGVGTFFEFNLASPLGLEAYKKFLMGNIIPAQQLAAKVKAVRAFTSTQNGIRKFATRMMVKPVRPLMNYKSKVSGHERKIRFAFPGLVSLKAKKGKSFVVTETKMGGSNVTVKTNLGVYKDERETFGLLKRSNYRLAMFAGTHQRIFKHTPKGDSIFSNRFSGNYKYQYHSKKLLEGELEEEIMNLIRRIGFKEKLSDLKIKQAAVNVRKYLSFRGEAVLIRGKKIPLNSKKGRKVLGPTKISADLMIGMKAIEELITKANKEGEKWVDGPLKKAKAWFENKENKRWEICTVVKVGAKSVLGRAICKKKIISGIKKGMDLAFKSLKKMDKNIKNNNFKAFSKNFADFGKGLSQNNFTFHEILNLIQKGDIHLVVQWEGERIPKGNLVLINSKSVSFEGLKRKGK